MPDFWKTSGFHLLERDDSGRLVITDEFLRAYFRRPELQPVDESNDAERALHDSLLETPRRRISDSELRRMEDPDAIENYTVALAFRDRLVESGTIEACYRSLFNDQAVAVPSLFISQLVHVILRGALANATPMQARAAELFFRSARITVQDGQILAADEETVDQYAQTGGFGDLGRLLVESGSTLREVTLDVLDEANAEAYWSRSDRFDTVLDLTFARPGLDGLCRVMERWIAHFTDLAVRIHPVQSIRDERWIWHIGLDVESSAILNDLYTGAEVQEDRLLRLVSLFRMEIKDQSAVLPRVAGRPIYLGLAMATDGTVRLKPQNLLVNLPLVPAS